MDCAIVVALQFLPLVVGPVIMWKVEMRERPAPGVAAVWALGIALVVAVYEGSVTLLFRSVVAWMPTASALAAFLLALLHWGLVLAPAPLVMYALARASLAGVATIRLWLLGWIAAVLWVAYSRVVPSLVVRAIVPGHHWG